MSKRLYEDLHKQIKLMKINEQNSALDTFIKNWMDARTNAEKDIQTKGLEDLDKYINQEKKSEKNKTEKKPKSSFDQVANTVIDKLEGGYYHPDMLKDGRYPGKSVMGDSGETMMGIDRKHGGTINTSAAGKEFWSIIDDSGARTKWKWNYKGGPLENKLRSLVVEMMKPFYEQHSNRYLSSEAREIVNSDPNLLFHFIYAVWNGPGWFQKFAKVINDEVKDGNTDPENLIQKAIHSRTKSGNSIIAQGGKKIDDILGTKVA